MAVSAAIKQKYFRRQAFYWLVLAGAMLVAWFVLWLASSAPAIIKKDDNKSQDAKVANLPTHIDALGELNSFVPPIDFSTLVRDLRTYPIEFKDKNYFNAKKFTVQIMDVSQNDVVVNYLNSRSDRDKFAYFRYLDENDNPRYVVTYGVFDSMELANSAMQTTNFNLPASVVPSAVSMADYLKIIDDYERGGAVRDASSRQPRQVKLQATRTEIPVQAATAADEALATSSRAKAEERAAQIQTTAEDANNQPENTAAPATGEKNDGEKPKAAAKPKAETDAPTQKSEDAPPKENQPVATPMVNTSKVPGSE